MKIDSLMTYIPQPGKRSPEAAPELPKPGSLPPESGSSETTSVYRSLLQKHEFSPTPDQRRAIESFLGGGPDRLATLDIALFKGIEPTGENLESVHAGLHRPFEPVDAQIAEELDSADEAAAAEKLRLPSAIRQSVLERVRQGMPLKQAIREVSSELGIELDSGISDAASEVRALREALSAGSRPIHADTAAAVSGGAEAKTGRSDVPTAGFPIPSGTVAVIRDAAVSEFPVFDGSSRIVSGASRIVGDAVRLAAETAAKAAGETAAEIVTDAGSRIPPGAARTTPGAALSPASELVRSDASYAAASRAPAPGEPETVHGSGRSAPGERGVSAESAKTGRAMQETESEESEADFDLDAMLESTIVQTLAAMTDHLSQTIDALDYRSYLVERQTELTAAASAEFDQFRQQFVSVLQSRPNAEGVKTAIDVLAKVLNKSHFAMMTDMKTEKKLLVASAELEKAQTLLRGGSLREAQRILGEVRRTVETLDFRPSVRRIQLLAEYRALRTDRALREETISVREHLAQGASLWGLETGRDALERIRMTGTNHEIEVYERSKPTIDLVNLKEILLRFDGGEEALGALTGQQMSNNSDDRGREFYSFDMPLSIDGEIAGMKVYLKGQSAENRLDWKNAELYFGLSTRNWGKLGIRARIVDAAVRLEFLSDVPELLRPRFSDIESAVSDIGYRKTELRFRSFEEPEITSPKPSREPSPARTRSESGAPDSAHGGIDFKI